MFAVVSTICATARESLPIIFSPITASTSKLSPDTNVNLSNSGLSVV